MGMVKILADSTCDLSEALRQQYDIDVVPLYVTLGAQSMQDGVTIDPQMIYRYFEETKNTPKTAASSITDFLDFFRPYVEKGCDIVYIGISSEMSGTVQNARMAAREYPQATIRCVDSRSLSTGIGLQVLMACDLAAEGKSANEIADTLECKTERVRASFVVDQMSFLYYGGRCSAVQAFGASLLNLRPQISVKDGRMYPTGKYRGNITRVARIYAEHALHDISRIVPKRVFITYSQDTDAAVVQAVRDVVTSKKYFEQILETEAGCVVTSHCGRNCIGVLFMEKE